MRRSVNVWSVSRKVLRALVIAGVALSMLGACEARGIGDPCTPEAIPADPDGPMGERTDGFEASEIYVETSSVQCRTRTCMVFRLEGNPERVAGEDSCPPGASGCVNPDLPVTSVISAERVFCSCRCSASGDVNTPLCECTDGFHCVDVLTAGGVGVAGGYCVPTDLCTSDDDCPAGVVCNDETGVCGA